jgi:uncharacterized protein YkwD
MSSNQYSLSKLLLLIAGVLFLVQCGTDRPAVPMMGGNGDHKSSDAAAETAPDSVSQEVVNADSALPAGNGNNAPSLPSSGNASSAAGMGSTTAAGGTNDLLSKMASGLGQLGGSSAAPAPTAADATAAGGSAAGGGAGDCISGDAVSCAAEFTLLVDTNAIRAEQSLPPLELDPRVSWVAREWSKKQGSSISHSGFPSARLADFSQQFPSEQAPRLSAENVAYNRGGSSAAAIGSAFARQWKNSSGHYRNMIGNFKAVGLGIYCQKSSGSAQTGGTSCTGTQIFIR